MSTQKRGKKMRKRNNFLKSNRASECLPFESFDTGVCGVEGMASSGWGLMSFLLFRVVLSLARNKAPCQGSACRFRLGASLLGIHAEELLERKTHYTEPPSCIVSYW